MSSLSPKVTLEAMIRHPYDLAVASARTCYSSKGIIRIPDLHVSEKSLELRDKISDSTREAGHLTTRQHAQLVFSIENVSRHFVWSFLHSHPFYNSEQVSQRYVKVGRDNYVTPPLQPKNQELFEFCIAEQMADYEKLIGILLPSISEAYFKIFPVRRNWLKRYEPTLKKKAYETARYVLPVATHTYLYHSISPLTLMRYYRLMDYFDTPWEQRQVVEAMVQAVEAADPDFRRELRDPYPIEETLEFKFLAEQRPDLPVTQKFLKEFDQSLGGRTSKLIDYKVNAPQTMAQAIRHVLGLSTETISDEIALEFVLNPQRNPQLGDTLNLNTLSKLTRTMVHPHYTFRKKLSHTADSQDQRHRMTPASRPILETHFTGEPDYIVPKLVREVPEALALYEESMKKTFKAIQDLLDRGEKKESALYLLPNAFPIRFEESGDLLHLHHKWHTRACYTAQEEIFQATIDELKEVQQVHPQLVRHILAPCYLRKEAGLKPICPEGERFCGVKVWKQGLEEYERVF